MRALETLAIYVTPFLILGALARVFMKRHGIDLTEVHQQDDPRQRPRRRFLLGAWRSED
jgi:hypothetical protein